MNGQIFPINPANRSPSAEYNDPSESPFKGRVGMLSEVSETAAIDGLNGTTQFTPQGPNNDLMSLRAKYPFLPIVPLPHETAACVLVVDNPGLPGQYRGEIAIPDGMVLGRFSFSAGPVYMNRNGNAEIPIVTTNQAASTILRDSWYYVGGIRSLAFAAPAAIIVTAEFYAPDQYPR